MSRQDVRSNYEASFLLGYLDYCARVMAYPEVYSNYYFIAFFNPKLGLTFVS